MKKRLRDGRLAYRFWDVVWRVSAVVVTGFLVSDLLYRSDPISAHLVWGVGFGLLFAMAYVLFTYLLLRR